MSGNLQVWAVDNRRLTYVRLEVSEEMPIGQEWVHVPGIQALDLTVSRSGVWALNTSGEILFRHGITETNVTGDYWKKVPGCFTKISGLLKKFVNTFTTMRGRSTFVCSRPLWLNRSIMLLLLQSTAWTIKLSKGGLG